MIGCGRLPLLSATTSDDLSALSDDFIHFRPTTSDDFPTTLFLSGVTEFPALPRVAERAPFHVLTLGATTASPPHELGGPATETFSNRRGLHGHRAK